jgi:hypothetical protein
MNGIKKWILQMHEKYGIEANYFPSKDMYSLMYRGKGIQNFTSEIFYQLPKRLREKRIYGIIRVGLNHNLGEKTVGDKIYLNRNVGKRITP